MDRANIGFVLLVTLAACSSGSQSMSRELSVHSTTTTRRCTTPLELRGEGHALSGVRGEFHEYPAAKVFSDDRVQVEWIVVRGVLNARVTNRTSSAATLGPVVIGSGNRSAGIPEVRVEPNSFQDVELISVREIETYFDASGHQAAGQGREFQIELGVRIGEQKCSYNFRLAAAAV